METAEQALAGIALHRSNRHAEAKRILAELPPVGVRAWEFPLAYIGGIVPGLALYGAGTPVATCLALAVGVVGASLAVAAGAQTRLIARRLAAVEAVLANSEEAAPPGAAADRQPQGSHPANR